jgi:hypothetical protein
MADRVEKPKILRRQKISRKSTFGRLYCCKAPQRRYDLLWSFLSNTMWPSHVDARETHRRSIHQAKTTFQHYRREAAVVDVNLASSR